MTKVSRRVVATGEWYQISCAVRSDGTTSPAAAFLDALRQNPATEGGEPDENISLYHWFIATFEYFAETGDTPQPWNTNQLNAGIWEFKRASCRISFFDTDGQGNYRPKISERQPAVGGGVSPLPEFDRYIRLGATWTKASQKAQQKHLSFAAQIRWENLQHDR
jgi:hypothetical protein